LVDPSGDNRPILAKPPKKHSRRKSAVEKWRGTSARSAS